MPSNLVPSVATSRPSKVELVVIAPVIAPPARGKAASAVTPSAATSRPSIVELVVTAPVKAPPARGILVPIAVVVVVA